MDLLNFFVTQHIDLLAFSTLNNGQGVGIEGCRLVLTFNLFKVKSFFDASNFYEVHAALRTIGMCTADINHIYFFS